MTFTNIVNGNEVFDGSGVDSTFRAGAGNDFLVGGGGDDFLSGGAGNDFIIGGGFIDGFTDIDFYGDLQFFAPVIPDDTRFDGADTLIGGAGADTLIGAGWNDTLVNDNGFFDFGEVEGPAFVIAIFPSVAPENVIWAGSGDDLALGGFFADTIGGGSGDDDLSGLAGNDILFGGSGADTLDGGTGADDLWSGTGDDVVFGGDGDDLIGAKSGNDEVTAGTGADTVFGGSGRDDIAGGAGADALYGGSGADTLWGDSGDDDIFGGSGDDALIGGTGEDFFYFADGHGDDTIDDFNIFDDALVLTHVNDIQNRSDLLFYSSEVVIGGTAGVLIETTADDSIFLAGLTLDDLSVADVIY